MKFFTQRRKIFFPLILVCLFLQLGINCHGQEKGIIVYKTYEDFVEKKGVEYKGDYKLRSFALLPGINNRTVTFKNRNKEVTENKKVKIKLKRVWGFSYNGYLMRVEDSLPHYLVSKGKICYYENGFSMVSLISKGHEFTAQNLHNFKDLESRWGVYSYISKSINSEIKKFSTKRQVKKMIKKMPEIKELYECVYPAKVLEAIEKKRKCISEYNTNVE